MFSAFGPPRSPLPVLPDDEVELRSRVSGLDLDRKVALLTGVSHSALAEEPRLGLRQIVVTDGPQGVRGRHGIGPGHSLLAPAPSALGATWDREIAERMGGLFASEAHRKGVHVLLAPLVNLQRTPVAGRHFEYFAEDPLLTGELAAGLVRGLQARGVAACVKHFVANESETDRTRYLTRLDERTLREIYLNPFETTVLNGGAWTVMAAYSGLDDGVEAAPMTEHSRMLRGVLKGDWEFSGVVISDWASTKSAVESANGGLDLVMPGPVGPWGPALAEAVRAGKVDESVVDDKVVRLLRLASRVGRLTDPWEPGTAPVPADPPPPPPSESEIALLRETAARGMVVLRNQRDLVPLSPVAGRRIALIGHNAEATYFQGGGSAYVTPQRTVNFVDGLRAALPPDVELTVHRGGDARDHLPLLAVEDLARDPDGTGPGIRASFFDLSGRLLGSDLRAASDWAPHYGFPAGTSRVVLRSVLSLSEPGTHRLEIGAVGRYRVLVDGELRDSAKDDRGVELMLDSSVNHPTGPVIEIVVDGGTRRVELEAELSVIDAGGFGRLISARFRHLPPGPSRESEIAEAVLAAERAEIAVVVVGTNEESESEGWDRTTLDLPGHQDELVRRVAAANPRTIVVVNAGAPVLLPWATEVNTILWAWLPGQEAGHALADVLLGRAEATGRLPWTLPSRAEDSPVRHAVPVDGFVDYVEGLHVGYRGWDRADATPAYPFGHGLGWTTWTYERVHAPHIVAADQDIDVRVLLANTGPRDGHEVVQVYLEAPVDGAVRPVRTLSGFTVVHCEAGHSVEATVSVPRRAFEMWDAVLGAWRSTPGTHRLHIGRSSRDLPLTAQVEVHG